MAHQLEGQVIAAGLDPTIGIIHGNSENRIPLFYDLMEPLRPFVDCKIPDFASGNTFTPGDFTITKSGGCRLNPQLVKQLVAAMIDPGVKQTIRQYVAALYGRQVRLLTRPFGITSTPARPLRFGEVRL